VSPILGVIASANQSQFISTNSYESIASTIVGSGGSATITFSSIPSTYQHLQIRAIGKTSASAQEILFQFNSDTGSNYNSHQMYGDGASAVANAKGTSTNGWVTYWENTQFGSVVFDILDYSNANKNTTTRSLGGHDLNGSGYVLFRSGLWINTAAITSITLFPSASQSFAQYSSFALYGIRG
jgi:hypothetical protein